MSSFSIGMLRNTLKAAQKMIEFTVAKNTGPICQPASAESVDLGLRQIDSSLDGTR